MSDNDLVKRGVIKERMIARGHLARDGDLVSRNWLLAEYDRQHEGSAGKARKLIEDAPAVPREMSAVEYIRISNQMLRGDYRAWDRLMVFEENDDADKAIAWTEEWAREHPEERSEDDD